MSNEEVKKKPTILVESGKSLLREFQHMDPSRTTVDGNFIEIEEVYAAIERTHTLIKAMPPGPKRDQADLWLSRGRYKYAWVFGVSNVQDLLNLVGDLSKDRVLDMELSDGSYTQHKRVHLIYKQQMKDKDGEDVLVYKFMLPVGYGAKTRITTLANSIRTLRNGFSEVAIPDGKGGVRVQFHNVKAAPVDTNIISFVLKELPDPAIDASNPEAKSMQVVAWTAGENPDYYPLPTSHDDYGNILVYNGVNLFHEYKVKEERKKANKKRQKEKAQRRIPGEAQVVAPVSQPTAGQPVTVT